MQSAGGGGADLFVQREYKEKYFKNVKNRKCNTCRIIPKRFILWGTPLSSKIIRENTNRWENTNLAQILDAIGG